ncbi:tripartite tricarboxylate transporter TctB family protein [Thalassobacillus pellis]|uniref:tripartite tricarboxylate transporter TctB family protein n=1 Tax=Thalassobacillus pellis TaxID=748008 RepID=UPI00195FC153|nr:tripartite tricarboxylate transporter TctB family protein [Thalassobacillus pellis]MBM7554459.1 phosphoglycerol transferase MdoB-like AlkP superfamily enzyme [Thalassobacillus pellis]
MQKERVQDIVVSIIVLAISFLFYINTKTLTPPADIFPKVVIGIFSILGVILLVKAIFYRKYGEEADEETPEKVDMKRRWFSITGLLAYIFLVPILGFYVTSGIYLVLVSISLNDEKISVKSLVKPITIASLVMLALYGTFTVFLRVPVPGGIFI